MQQVQSLPVRNWTVILVIGQKLGNVEHEDYYVVKLKNGHQVTNSTSKWSKPILIAWE